jgi:hypothetical protein
MEQIDKLKQQSPPMRGRLTYEEVLRRYVRELRGSRTQKEFAKLVGIPQSVISDMERGRARGGRWVNIGHLDQLARGQDKSLVTVLSDVLDLAVRMQREELAALAPEGKEYSRADAGIFVSKVQHPGHQRQDRDPTSKRRRGK